MAKIDIANNAEPTTPTSGNTIVYVDSTSKKLSTKDDAGVVTDYSSVTSLFTSLTDTPSSYSGEGTKVLRVNVAENAVEFVDASTVGVTDHGALTGLTGTDHHTQYALLAGRASGQTLIGGTASGDDLTLQTTSNATKGSIFFGATTTFYDETNDAFTVGGDFTVDTDTFHVDSTNNRVGIGTTTPGVDGLDITNSSAGARIDLNSAANSGGAIRAFGDNASAGANLFQFNAFNDGTVAAQLRLSTGSSGASKNDGRVSLFTTNAGSASERLRVDEFGNINIAIFDNEARLNVKGRDTITLTGSIDPAASTAVVGVGTAFLSEVAVGDEIIVTGETRAVSAITDDTNLTVSTAFSDNANDTSPDVVKPLVHFVDQSDNSKFIVTGSNGYVGIGTAAPLQPLHIVTDAGNIQFDGNNIGMLWHELDDDVYVQTLFNNSLYRYRPLDSSLAQVTSGFTLDVVTGKFGVNETSPNYSLEVTGSITSGYFGVTNASDGDLFNIDSSGDVTIGQDLVVDTDTLVVDSTNNTVGVATTNTAIAAAFVIERGSPTNTAGGSGNEGAQILCANATTENIRAMIVEAEAKNATAGSVSIQGLNAFVRYSGAGNKTGGAMRAGNYQARINTNASITAEITGVESGMQVDATFTPTITEFSAYEVSAVNMREAVVTTYRGLEINNPFAFSGSGSLTNYYGIVIDDLTRATNNRGIMCSLSSGSNKYNLYIDGTADNYIEGDTGIGESSPTAKLHVDQNSATGAAPPLLLKQTDVSEEMIELDGTTIGVGNAIEAVGAKTLTTTHFIKITITGVGTRYIPCGTIA